MLGRLVYDDVFDRGGLRVHTRGAVHGGYYVDMQGRGGHFWASVGWHVLVVLDRGVLITRRIARRREANDFVRLNERDLEGKPSICMVLATMLRLVFLARAHFALGMEPWSRLSARCLYGEVAVDGELTR